ncbi:MAG: glutamyl-tRNA reductase [Candidatus Omnitrophica bacterium]|nr:glutamyl-tRNA reductase [Candidatus Omnitrophota bacterium]
MIGQQVCDTQSSAVISLVHPSHPRRVTIQPHLLLVGVNYRTAPVELRERLAIPSRDLPEALRTLRAIPGVDEAVILSTCNRIECYVVTAQPDSVFSQLVEFLAYRSRVPATIVQSASYHFTDNEVMTHVCRVAAGLDSMVLGECEVTAQVKQAYLLAHAHHATGPVLNRLFQKTLHTTKQLRCNTTIAQGRTSIGSIVAALAAQPFDNRLDACEALLWGAGKAAEATAKHLIKGGIRQLWIVNRTQTKAQDLALLCEGGWLSWEQALKHLAHVDIVIVCTQAPHYVIDRHDVEAIRAARGGRPLCIVDLAVPRNVDPVLKDVAGVFLYNVDDLQAMACAGQTQRQRTLALCDELIARQATLFMAWWQATMATTKEGAGCQLDQSRASV